MNFGLLKASGPNCIPVVVLMNCKPKLSYILVELFNKCLKKSFFQTVGRSLWCSLYLRMLGNGLQLKSTTLLVFFLWSVKSSKNLRLRQLLITQRIVVFFLISSLVLGLLNQLKIFLQFYLIEFLGLSRGMGLLKLHNLIYPRLLTKCGMLVFFTNLRLMEFQVRLLALFLLFSVISGFAWS